MSWEEYVDTDEKYLRPNEVDYLKGDSTQARKKLGWNPKVSFDQLVEMMVEADLESAEKEKVLYDNGLLNPTWENSI